MARFSLRALPGIPRGSISASMSTGMRSGTDDINEILEFAKRVAYDAAWPIIVHDAERNDIGIYRVSVFGAVLRLTAPSDDKSQGSASQAINMPVK